MACCSGLLTCAYLSYKMRFSAYFKLTYASTQKHLETDTTYN